MNVLEKGGQIVKVKEPSTKIKLSLVPDNEIAIDNVKQEDLYHKKTSDKINNGKKTDRLVKYNQELKGESDADDSVSNISEINYSENSEKNNDNNEHPTYFDENSSEMIHEKSVAMKNAELLVTEEEEVSISGVQNNNLFSIYEQNKTLIIVGSIFLAMAIIYLLVKYLIPKLRKIILELFRNFPLYFLV